MPTASNSSSAPLFQRDRGDMSGRLHYGVPTWQGPLFGFPYERGTVPVGGGTGSQGQAPLFNSGTVPIGPYVPPPVVISPYGSVLVADTPQNPNIGGDTAGPGNTGAPPGQSFSEGSSSGLTGLNGPASAGKTAITTALGVGSGLLGMPVSIGMPVTAALALESALKAFTTAFPNLSVQAGMLPGVTGNIRGDVAAQRSGERSLTGPTLSTSLTRSGSDEPEDPGIPSDEPATVDEPPAISEGITAPTAPTGQIGLTAQGGLIGGVGGPPGGMASVSNSNTGPQSNVVEGPPGASPGTDVGAPGSVGIGSGLSSTGEVGVAGQGGPSDGGGAGDGGGGGGCFLASFAMEALPDNERQTARRFFTDFHRLFLRSYPGNGVQLFRTYQVVARKIIDAIRARGTDKVEQKFIYDKLIKPTGRYIEKRELKGAISNLQSIVTTLAKKYDVPLPAKRVLK